MIVSRARGPASAAEVGVMRAGRGTIETIEGTALDLQIKVTGAASEADQEIGMQVGLVQVDAMEVIEK